MQLSQTLEKTMAYCEGDKNHPFLEEVVTIFASYFESLGSYQNAFIMWSKFLKIQQNLFGDDREQMITTYKKLATLAVQIGQSDVSQKYLGIANELHEKHADSTPDSEKTEEEIKEGLEYKAQLLFQQYLAA